MVDDTVPSPALYKGVMVSSTSTDLVRHRATLIKAVDGGGLKSVVMEHGSAKLGVDVIESSLQMVRDASAYVGVISHRYGQTPESPERNPDRLSLTELEFNEASRLGRIVLLFVMGDDHDVKPGDVEKDKEKIEKLNAFRERAKRLRPDSSLHRIYKVFNSLQEFEVAATRSIADLQRHLDQQTAPSSEQSRDPASAGRPAPCDVDPRPHVPESLLPGRGDRALNPRPKISQATIGDVLMACRRRCCMCLALDGDSSEKEGQIAHLDHDPGNNGPDNLAFLCPHHHNAYDARTSQSKAFTTSEVKRYRDELLFVITRVIQPLRGSAAPLLAVEVTSPRGTTGSVQRFPGGALYSSQRAGAHVIRDDILHVLDRFGGAAGRLGFPVTGDMPATPSPQGTAGVCQRFECEWDFSAEIASLPGGLRFGATAYYSAGIGGHPTWGGIGECYERGGGTGSGLGFPTSDELQTSTSPRGTQGYYQIFEGGIVLWCALHDAHAVYGAMRDVYDAAGGTKSLFGFPVTDQTAAQPSVHGTPGVFQRFQGPEDYPADLHLPGPRCGASMYWSERFGAYWTWGPIGVCYERLRGTGGHLGFPTSEQRQAGTRHGSHGLYQVFEGGHIYGHGDNGARPVSSQLLRVYRELGGPEGVLGFPVADPEHADDSGHHSVQRFERGHITIDGAVAQITVPVS